MKTKRLIGVLVFGFGLALVLLLVLSALADQPARAAPICARYVVSGGSDSTNCASYTNPCKTIQYALQQAASGDRICVADRSDLSGPTTYYGTVVVTKSVTLNGAWETRNAGDPFTAVSCPSQNVVIDGQGLGRVISITGNITPTIQCFTITGGNAGGAAGDPNKGGGIAARDAAPIILSNIITGNSGCIFTSCTGYGRGGGIYLVNAPATAVISGNLIANNWADNTSSWGQGGGIYMANSHAQVFSNVIQANRAGTSAGDGGGIYVTDGSPTIADNKILTNTSGTGVMCHGGGVFVQSSTPVTIERNLIQNNRALSGSGFITMPNRGGGVYFEGPFAVIRDNTVRLNTATTDEAGLGGGMYLRNLSAAAVVSGNVVADDNRASYSVYGEGGGIHLDGCWATVTDNRVFGNIAASSTQGWGGGVYINGGGGLLQGNTITGNLALLGAVSGDGWGGGIAISNSQVIVQDNWIAQNAGASAPDANGVGGGVVVLYGAPRFLSNHILSNTANSNVTGGDMGFGGGLFLEEARPWLDGNVIQGNRATGVFAGRGGGVRIASCPAFTLTNNIVARNAVSSTGSGIAIHSSTGRLAHNTIAENRTGDQVGVLVESSGIVTLTNNIIVSQSVGISRTSGTTVVAQYTLFESNGLNYAAGVNNTNQVAGPAALFPNYHLRSMSGAIDHATPLAWVTSDVDGEARPIGALPDVGADEKTSVCDRYVLNVDTTDVGRDCTDSTHPCRTVTYALGQALDGDRICVADHPLQPGPSVYTGTHLVNKSVTLDGAWEAMCVDPSDLTCSFWAVTCAPANVVLDAQRAGRVISITGNVTPTIQCFTITGGNATGLTANCQGSGGNPDGCGGGIFAYNAHPIIVNNIITNNIAAITTAGYPTGTTGYGGGVYLRNANQTVISGNVIISNVASAADCGAGGGVYLYNNTSGTRVQSNQVLSNHASLVNAGCAWGGGIYGGPDGVLIQGNLVEGNRTNSVNTGYGAGLFQWYGSANYQGNLVQRNHGAHAVYLGYSRSRFESNRVVDNATTRGVQLQYGVGSGPTLVNNVIARNGTYALEADGYVNSPLTATLLHNTLVGSGTGYGVYAEDYATLYLTNTIVVSTTWGITNTFPASSTVHADHTLFWANTNDGIRGTSPVDGNPAFVADGYHLGSGSAAINRGVNAGVTTDIDGNARPDWCFFDIGADEFITGLGCGYIHLPLVLRNY